MLKMDLKNLKKKKINQISQKKKLLENWDYLACLLRFSEKQIRSVIRDLEK